ncbi:MAG TPA: DUF5715 family protein [Candidatus Eisenbacteria bacterium]|nr:DUF5715 family protein [Candidatus Eisenbacteria bacterium]
MSAATAVSVWALLHFTRARRRAESAIGSSSLARRMGGDTWNEALAKIKADRGDPGSQVALEIPTELQHYSDRHWFLATQIAEVRKQSLHTCQDFVDLAVMLERGELVAVPAVTDTYILFGVGGNANDEVFSKYEDDTSIKLYDETELQDEYQRLANSRSQLSAETEGLKKQLNGLKKRDRARQKELQTGISARQQKLKAIDEDKTTLDRFYGQPESRQALVHEYESLKMLAQNLDGRVYNLQDPADRMAMKITMLRSLRPQALKALEEIATDYHRMFDRPLPVSSLIRPEQYQHALRKVNRNAVLIDTPPHSTGLAFDIDYRYMSNAEQNFLMAALAGMKKAGRVEVIRERNANYHVFVFLDGVRPSDELITAAIPDAGAPDPEANHANSKPAPDKKRSRAAAKSQVTNKKPNSKAKRRRR